MYSLTSKQLPARPSGEQWSGEATRNLGLAVEETRVDVAIVESDNAVDVTTQRKERPVWMVESTIVTNDQVHILHQPTYGPMVERESPNKG